MNALILTQPRLDGKYYFLEIFKFLNLKIYIRPYGPLFWLQNFRALRGHCISNMGSKWRTEWFDVQSIQLFPIYLFIYVLSI